jgi:hypothetical protein
MALAALSGLKIALGPAFLTTARGRPSSRNWILGAMAEMFLDKVGVFPPRYRPGLLVPHTLAGAWVARESLREDGEDNPWAAPMGAIVAAGVASVAPMVRIAASRLLGVHDAVLGVAEDYCALQLGTRAMDMSIDQVTEAAKESISGIGERVMPALESVATRF